ncbi:hypothetical protein B0H11DRAFT_2248410 [Mycena galericulata]|nr:hypothetical protein B0H11DRAFT_2248410 [Mycena galericulata]
MCQEQILGRESPDGKASEVPAVLQELVKAEWILVVVDSSGPMFPDDPSFFAALVS